MPTPQPKVVEKDTEVVPEVLGILQEIFPDDLVLEDTDLVNDIDATVEELIRFRDEFLKRFGFYLFSTERITLCVKRKEKLPVSRINEMVKRGLKHPERYQKQ